MDVLSNTQCDRENAHLANWRGKAVSAGNRVQKRLLNRVKKCPQCFSNLPMQETVCPWCNQRMKASADKHGYAKKPVNWYAYLTCLVSWLGLAMYIWWAFLK